MPLSLKKHVTLPRNQAFTFSCLCNPLTGRRTLPIVLIVPLSYLPSHSHSKAHSCLLSLTLLMHCSYSCSSFLTCSHTLILVAYLAFPLHGTLSFATLTLRRTLPSTLSSHSPLSRHPVRVTLSHDTHVLSLTHRRINTTRCRSAIFILCLHPEPIRAPQRPSAHFPSLSSRSPLLS